MSQGNRRSYTRYARAPITEAIVEIRVKPADDVTPSACRAVFESVREEFADLQEIHTLEASIVGGNQIGAQASQRVAGYAARSKELNQIVTAFPDRFVFSQLPPYDCWEVFRPACQRFWNLYVATLKPLKAVRIATRFVNRIEIPKPIIDIGEYFRTAPIVSTDMSTEIAGAFMQLRLPQKDLACQVVLSEAILPDSETTVPFILDVDIFDESRELEIDDKIWARLDEFRWRKNEIFEACITDRVRKLIS